jgi:hypothetical protein
MIANTIRPVRLGSAGLAVDELSEVLTLAHRDRAIGLIPPKTTLITLRHLST